MITAHHAKIVNSILLAVLLVSVYSCSDKNSGIDIRLSENQRIEDMAAGWWIKDLDLENGKQSKYITVQMHYRLIQQARLINRYNNDRNGLVAIWEYYGKTNPVIIKEEIYEGSDGQTIWMSYEYPSPGVLWSKVIPADYQRLKPNRKYEHAVTIHSTADKGARIFLFGWGDYCTRISIF